MDVPPETVAVRRVAVAGLVHRAGGDRGGQRGHWRLVLSADRGGDVPADAAARPGASAVSDRCWRPCGCAPWRRSAIGVYPLPLQQAVQTALPARGSGHPAPGAHAGDAGGAMTAGRIQTPCRPWARLCQPCLGSTRLTQAVAHEGFRILTGTDHSGGLVMSADLPNTAAAEVLRQYPRPLWSGAPLPLGNRGGFSGARLWRLDGPAGPLCLRAWPAGFLPSTTRLHPPLHDPRPHRRAGVRAAPVRHGGGRPRPSNTPADCGSCRSGFRGKRITTATRRRRSSAAASFRPGPAARLLARRPPAGEAALAPPSADGWTRPRMAQSCCNPAGGRRPASGDDPARPAAEQAWRLLPGWIDAVSRSV